MTLPARAPLFISKEPPLSYIDTVCTALSLLYSFAILITHILVVIVRTVSGGAIDQVSSSTSVFTGPYVVDQYHNIDEVTQVRPSAVHV